MVVTHDRYMIDRLNMIDIQFQKQIAYISEYQLLGVTAIERI